MRMRRKDFACTRQAMKESLQGDLLKFPFQRRRRGYFEYQLGAVRQACPLAVEDSAENNGLGWISPFPNLGI